MPRRALVLSLRGGAAVVLVALLWAALALLSVKDDLEQARAAVETARDADDSAQARRLLGTAEQELDRSVGRLEQPGPALAAHLPLAGRTVRAVTRTCRAALAVVRGGREVLDTVEGGSPLLAGGQVDLDRLADVEVALARAAHAAAPEVAELAEQPLGLVPGRVAGPVRTAQRELTGLPTDLADAAAALKGLRAVLGAEEPQHLLILLENNAELRATGGLVSVFAEAIADDGELELAPFRDVEDVADPAGEARRVPAPDDFSRLYGGFLADTTLWKNTNMSPDVPTSSQVMAEVMTATTGRPADAILWLDVPTIAAVLRATGPVELPDGELLRPEDVVPRLLSTAYRDAPDTPQGREQRRQELRDAADAVVGRVLGAEADVPAQALARELLDAARGRHLALWAADAETQSDLVRGGVAGAVTAADGDLSAVAVHNLGGGDTDGNKLDFYGRRQTTVRVRLAPDVAVVEQEIALRNAAPSRGLPVYVSGRVTPGVNNAYVTLALPTAAEQVVLSRDGQRLDGRLLPAGDHAVVQDVVSLPPGAATTWRLSYRLPLVAGRYDLALFPQPLAVDSGLSVEVTPDDGVKLSATGGTELTGGGVRISGPYATVARVTLAVERPGRLERWRDALRRFWNEPVRLP